MPPAKTFSSELVGVADGDAFRGEKIGKYEVLTQLSLGGMAELFLCFTSGPGGFRKYVVVKRILPDVRSDDHFVKMFLDEARITAAFNHPNIAAVFDLGEEEGLFLAMEFISGQNLNQITSAARKHRMNMPVGFCAAIARDTCLALHYAHTFTTQTGRKLPVIHRDVAQKNVMVTYEGVTKLLDFGIAKAKGSLGRTHVGMVKGTTGYMSPEQVQGLALDGRSDVFSVGVMLHELLTGRRLFAGETEEEEMRKILSAPVPKPRSLEPSIPEALSDVVMRSLARERADRYNTAKDMAKALDQAMGNALFDQEKLAAFMRELFQEKMAATRALLESADGDDQSFLVKSAVGALKAPTDEPAVPAASAASAAMTDPVERSPSPVKRGKDAEAAAAAAARLAPKDDRKRFDDLDLEPTMLKAPELDPPSGDALPRHRPTPMTDPSNPMVLNTAERAAVEPNRSTLWLALLAVVVLGLGVGVWALLNRAPERKTATGDIDETHSVAPRPLSTNGGTPLPSTASTRPEPQADVPVTPTGRRGYVTLITKPEALVYRGRTALGKTPLFNVPLLSGNQTLKLKGPDGHWHTLVLPVKAGRNPPYRLDLDGIPEN